MQRLASVLVLAALLACVSCLNLVDDPSFEEDCIVGDVNQADEWNNNLAAISGDFYPQFGAHSGECISDFFNVAGNTEVAVSQPYTFLAAHTYRMTAWIAAVDVGGVVVGFTAGTFSNSFATSNQFWTQITDDFTPGADTDFSFTLINGNGVIDDISIFCVSGGSCPAIMGDPHITGLNGEKIDIVGEDKSVFNLVSDRDVQVNTRLGLIRTDDNIVLGNYMKQMAFMLRNHTVLVNAGGSSAEDVATLIVDGQKVLAPFSLVINEESLPAIKIDFRKATGPAFQYGIDSSDNVASILDIKYGFQYEFLVLNIENGHNHGSIRRFLDFSAHIEHSRDPEGAFGRTLHPENKRSSANDINQYSLPSGDIFGKDFDFNLFTAV